jgi:hypothetical protein
MQDSRQRRHCVPASRERVSRQQPAAAPYHTPAARGEALLPAAHGVPAAAPYHIHCHMTGADAGHASYLDANVSGQTQAQTCHRQSLWPGTGQTHTGHVRPDTGKACACVCPVSALCLFACVCSPASVRLRLFACVCSPASVRLRLFACICSPASVSLRLFACICSPASVRLHLFACV